MRQTEVFAFIVTNDGWILFRTSMSNIQPSNAAKPIENVSDAKMVDRVLQSANCRGGYSDRASCVVSGVKSVGTVQSLFGGIGLSLYRLVTFDKLCDKCAGELIRAEDIRHS